MDSPLSLSTVNMKPADFYSKVHRPQREERNSPPPTTEKLGVRTYMESKSPRMRWTKDMHKDFLRVVEQLGGEERVTPMMVFELMNVRGLTVTHVKSHLQMFRTMKHKNKILEVENENIQKSSASSSNSTHWEVEHASFAEMSVKSNNACFYSGNVPQTMRRSTLWEPVQLMGKESEVIQQGLYTSDVSEINNFGLPRFNYSTMLKDFIKSIKPTSTETSPPNVRSTIKTQDAKEVMRQIIKERQKLLQDQVNTKIMTGLVTTGASTSQAPKSDISLELTLG